MEHFIIILAICLIYFNISGLATTNILRLTAGNTLPILASKCYCDSCKAKISPILQLPIISYILCKGRCKNCHTKLPVYALFLEIAVFAGMLILTAVCNFSFIGVALSFLYYEIVRVVMILVRGRRQIGFGIQYIIAVLSMFPFFIAALFSSLLYTVV